MAEPIESRSGLRCPVTCTTPTATCGTRREQGPAHEMENATAMAFLYLLRCADGSLYCGWTTDVPRRLRAHESGRASRYTASRRPVALAAAWELPSRAHARRAEVRVKRLPRDGKLALVGGAPLDGAVRLPPLAR